MFILKKTIVSAVGLFPYRFSSLLFKMMMGDRYVENILYFYNLNELAVKHKIRMIEQGFSGNYVGKIYVSGNSRTGKTLFSKRLAERLNFAYFSFDEIYPYYKNVSSGRRYKVKSIIMDLIQKVRCNMIVDGDELITNGVIINGVINKDSIDFNYISGIARFSKFPPVIIGSSSVEIEYKARLLANFAENEECWTNRVRNDICYYEISKNIVENSKYYQSMADAFGFVYYDIDCGHFIESLYFSVEDYIEKYCLDIR